MKVYAEDYSVRGIGWLDYTVVLVLIKLSASLNLLNSHSLEMCELGKFVLISLSWCNIEIRQCDGITNHNLITLE